MTSPAEHTSLTTSEVLPSGGLVHDHVSGTLSELDKRVVEAVPPGGNWQDLPLDFPSKRIDQIRASAARGEGSRSTYYGRLRWERSSYTISTYMTRPGNGCFIHPEAQRLITLREAARLQTFPDSWRFSGTMRQRAMQIGNAVPPLMAAQLGRMLPTGSAADLFSGVGGLSLGLSLAGHAVVGAVDHEPAAIRTHNMNFDGEAFEADLDSPAGMKSTWAELRKRAGGSLDLLAGGPPCQGFSTAGKALKDDPRNRLLWSFVEGVSALRPRTVLMENVVALAQSRGKNHLAAVRNELDKLGYKSEYKILHAEAYGVPQRRRRVILLASRDELPEWPAPHYELEIPMFATQQPGPLATASGNTVHDAISDLPSVEAEALDSPVSLGQAQSELQRWLRGESQLSDLLNH